MAPVCFQKGLSKLGNIFSCYVSGVKQTKCFPTPGPGAKRGKIVPENKGSRMRIIIN